MVICLYFKVVVIDTKTICSIFSLTAQVLHPSALPTLFCQRKSLNGHKPLHIIPNDVSVVCLKHRADMLQLIIFQLGRYIFGMNSRILLSPLRKGFCRPAPLIFIQLALITQVNITVCKSSQRQEIYIVFHVVLSSVGFCETAHFSV